MVYAVIDTNVFVSALITHNSNASIARVLENLLLHRIIPLYNDDIIKEYDEVLHRAKFKLSEEQISTVIEHVKENGIDSSRFPYAGEMPDEDDRVFYEVCLSKEDSFLVTGNLKHFPKEPQVITAAEMMEILDNEL
ncbi:putative toxin-antitoxin system toxin component, PIN family [Segatella sp.]|uniref:putative toxin-antitoxin system toxin component, PIN family n=1 Tax=Segatella sp. TaxID=2974253 RepID=UPI003079F7EF